MFWWQGENNMPKLIKMTYQSIVDNSNGHEVILLSQVNYSSFVDVPQTILDKVVNKKMSFAHLSDFIRLQLLSRYPYSEIICKELIADTTFFLLNWKVEVSKKRWMLKKRFMAIS